jgi:hypothetical protein
MNKKEAEIHATALQQFDKIQGVVQEERDQCLADRRFYSIAGAQWEGALSEQFENKPMFEVNKIHHSVMRIINEYRNNRITVDFVSKDGSPSDDLSDALDGLYRADEEDSCADEAYDNAFEEAVGGGMGAWRLRAELEDEHDPECETQRIRIEPIFDADSTVFWDLNSQRQDKSDAGYCFVLTPMTREAYTETYDDDPADWPKNVSGDEFDWASSDTVYVAEYYVVELKKENIYVYKDVMGKEEEYTEEELAEKAEELAAVGTVEDRVKKVKTRNIKKYILSGGKVLEDGEIIAGKFIPIVPVYGKRWVVDNKERCMGHVRLAKDIQRLKNMQLSKLAELSAISSVAKPIFTDEQIAGHEEMWEADNIKNWAYLLVNPVQDAQGNAQPMGPVGHTQPPQIAPAMAAILQISDTDMQDLLGSQQKADEIQPNISGKAVELIQNRLDMQTFIYMSNMAKAVKRSGEIWLSMAKDIMVEPGRKMKSIGDQGQVSSIELMKPVVDPRTNATTVANDLSRAKYDVMVDVGPSSSSRRAATVRALTGMIALTQDPETKQVLESVALMNMEGEGLSDIHEFFRRRLVTGGVIEPNEEEREQMTEAAQNRQPAPNDQLLQAAAQAEQAKAQKLLAEVELTKAKTDDTRANTMDTIADIPRQDAEAAQKRVKNMAQIRQQAEGGNPNASFPR